MPTTRSKATRMTAAAVRHPGRTGAAALALVAMIAAVAAGGGGGATAASAPSGPVATASTRDLATTLETTGVLERTEQRTISYAGTLAPGAAASPSGATVGAPSTAATASATGGALRLTSSVAAAQVDPTACGPAGPETTTTTTACVPVDTTTTTTTVAPPITPTAPAPTTAQTTTTAGRQGTSAGAATPGTSAPVGQAGAATAPTVPAVVAEDDPAILTAVAALGSEVERGTVLYAADDVPVVALAGPVPAWRTLETGVDAGADVHQLEENLTALGFGAGLSVDDEFTSGTTAAVERWEAALGREDPDGVVVLGDVVFLTLPGKVLSHEAGVGDPLDAGAPILVLGSRQQLVRATVVVGRADSWAAGSEVALAWSDRSTTTGTVSGTGHDVTDGMVELLVAVGDADNTRPSGAQVSVTVVDARRDGVVAVPVAAVVEGPGGKAAVRRVVAGGATDLLVTVTTGIVAGGWIEIRSGLAVGDPVRLPG